MTRIPRTHIEGALYYVTSRGDHNEDIFRDEQDYKMYLELLKKYKEQYGFKLFTFIFLPNHLHLLIELKEGISISDIMHDLNSNYTKYFNGRYERKGHLFQERYKLVLLEKESYLLALSSYIHLNPLKLNLAREISEYPHSSYLYYIGKAGELDLDQELGVIREKLGNRSYEEFLKGISREDMERLAEDLRKKPILGSQEFRETIRQKAEAEKREGERLRVRGKGVNKRFILVGSALILILGVLNLYLYAETLGLKTHFSKALREKETHFKNQIDDYYREMSKSLEIEKQKARYLEEKLSGEARKK